MLAAFPSLWLLSTVGLRPLTLVLAEAAQPLGSVAQLPIVWVSLSLMEGGQRALD